MMIDIIKAHPQIVFKLKCMAIHYWTTASSLDFCGAGLLHEHNGPINSCSTSSSRVPRVSGTVMYMNTRPTPTIPTNNQ